MKVTIENKGKTTVMEGDFVYGFVGNKFEGGCATRTFLVGDVPTLHLPQHLAKTACATLANLDEENPLSGYALMVEFEKQVEENVKKKMTEDADLIASGIGEFLKSLKRED